MNNLMSFKDHINSICKKEKISEGRAFIQWILNSYYDIMDSDVNDYITDNGEDKRIDAYITYEKNRLILIQAKYSNDCRKEISEKDIVLFYSCLNTLKNPSQLSSKSQIIDVAESFKDVWESEGVVELHYFIAGTFNDSSKKERITFNNIQDYNNRIQLYYHDIDDIISTYEASISEGNPLADETVEFPIIENQYFKNNLGIYPSYIFSIKADILAKIYEIYKNKLFDRNIRYYKGAKSGTINAQIIDTIGEQKDRKNFWYYNNGITIVCSLIRENFVNDKNSLSVTGPQIINGCQTTVSIFEAYEKFYENKEIPKDVYLLIRIIQANLKDTDDITLYTNSQNPVSAYQLRSNDGIQKKIKDDLKKLDPPYFYERKEGEKNLYRKVIKKDYNNKVIEMVRTAQVIYSSLFDPIYARRYRENLFAEHYDQIFKKDITFYEILLPNHIFDKVNNNIQKYKEQEYYLVKTEEITDEKRKEILSKEFLLYSNLIYMYFIWTIIKKKYGYYDSNIARKLLNNQLNDRTQKMIDYITTILIYNNELQKSNPQRFLKSKPNIDKVKDEILKEIDKDKAKGKNPLKDFLPSID